MEKLYELENPHYLYFLGIIPLLGLLFAYNLYWQRKKQREFGDPAMVGKLMPTRSVFKAGVKLMVMLLALAGLVLALVNPKAGVRSETVNREGIDIIFAIDVSKSMLAEDVQPSRLEKAKLIVSEVINRMGNDRVGIVAYAGNAYPVLPITTDYSVAKMFLQGMNTDMVSSQGTAIADALRLSSKSFDHPKSGKAIVLLSDGEDHGVGSGDAARELEQKGIKLITVGIGTEKGGPIPLRKEGRIESYKRDSQDNIVTTRLYPKALENLAEATDGGYIHGNSAAAVSEFMDKKLGGLVKSKFAARKVTVYETRYQWFLGAAMLLLLLDIFLLERKTRWLSRLNLFNDKTK